MESYNLAAYVLGMKSHFRGEKVLDFLRDNDIDTTVVWGMDPKTFGEDLMSNMVNQQQAKFLIGRELTLGEISCALGHLEMYELFLRSGRRIGLFLEDDVIIDDTLIEFLSDFIEVRRAQVINLAGYLNTNLMPTPFPISLSRKGVETQSSYYMFNCLRFPYCAYGYLMNREAAQIAVTAMRGKKINSQADFPFSWRTLVEFNITLIPIVNHSHGVSILDADRKRIEGNTEVRKSIDQKMRTVRMLNPFRIFRGKRIGLSGRALFLETYSYYLLSKYFPKSILNKSQIEKRDSQS